MKTANNNYKKLFLALIISAAVLVIATILAKNGADASSPDGQFLLWLQDNARNAFLTGIFSVIFVTGNQGIVWIILGLVLIVSGCVLLFSIKRRYAGTELKSAADADGILRKAEAGRILFIAGFAVVLAFALSLIVTNGCIKPIVHRTRPYAVMDSLTLLVPAESNASFPSGHASVSFAAAIAVFLVMPAGKKKFGVIVIAFAAVLSFSRLYVGVHYPTDVIAGIAAGTVCGILSVMILGKIGSTARKKQSAA